MNLTESLTEISTFAPAPDYAVFVDESVARYRTGTFEHKFKVSIWADGEAKPVFFAEGSDLAALTRDAIEAVCPQAQAA